MPPPDSGVPALTEDEKMMFARWIDLGAPIDSPDPVKSAFGWFADDLRPTLTVSSPARGRSLEPLSIVRIGAYDYYSGLDRASLSVSANFEINGQPPSTELGPLFTETGDHVWTLSVSPPIVDLHRGQLNVSIKDTRGNITTVERTFSIGLNATPPDLDADRDQTLADGEFELELRGEPQGSYLIETTHDLIQWEPWQVIQDFDGVQKVLDSGIIEQDQRFYRATEIQN